MDPVQMNEIVKIAEEFLTSCDALGVIKTGLELNWETMWPRVIKRLTAVTDPRLVPTLRKWHAFLRDFDSVRSGLRYNMSPVFTTRNRLHQWLKADPERRAPDDDADLADLYIGSDAFRVMAKHMDVFEGYPMRGGGKGFEFAPPIPLYSISGDPFRLHIHEYDDGLRRQFLAAMGELVVYESDEAYLADIEKQFSRFLTIEDVAVKYCGYPRQREVPNASHDAWLRPIRAVEAALEDLLIVEASADQRMFLEGWLRGHLGCGLECIGVRFPPCFMALIVDLLLVAMSEPNVPELIRDAIMYCVAPEHDAPTTQNGRPSSLWLLYGYTQAPSYETLTIDWDDDDTDALNDCNGVFGVRLLTALRRIRA